MPTSGLLPCPAPAHGRLVGSLPRLVAGQGLGRIHVAECRMLRDNALQLRQSHPETLCQHGGDRARLHLADRGEREQPGQQVRAIPGLGPYSRRVRAIPRGDRRAQGLDPVCHRPREAVQGRALAEDALQLARIHARDARRIQMADPTTQLGWAGECLLDSHLLIETEADQQGQRIGGEQPI